MDPRGNTNAFYVFVGPSGSGKTTAVTNLVIGGNNTLKKPIEQMLIVSKHPEQSSYLRLASAVDNLAFLKPTAANLKEEEFLKIFNIRTGVHAAVLFDDVESEKIPGLYELLGAMATRLCHHVGFTAFLTVHSLFYNNDTYRLIQKNASYLCFMQQVRERYAIRNLSSQIFSGRNKDSGLLSDAFDAVCKGGEPYEYLILDLNHKTLENLRVRQSFDVRLPLITYEQQ